MRRKDMIELVRLQLAASGLAVLHTDTLYAAMPALWSSRQEAMLNAVPLAEIVGAVMTEYPTATFFEFNAEGVPMLGVARTLDQIEQRLEWLTGRAAKSVKPVQPGSLTHRENTRITELKQPVVDEFAGFDLEAFIKTLPTWSCATRAEGILKLQRYWRRYPDQYRPEVYDASEKTMRAGFEAELQEKAA